MIRRCIIAALSLVLLANCAAGERTPPQNSSSPHLLEISQRYLKDIRPEGIQHKILADGYITDAELNEAYDNLVKCLSAHNLRPGWDLSFGPGANYAPSIDNQQELSSGLDDEEWNRKFQEEIMPQYDACDAVSTYGVIQVYTEQTFSSDGRSRNIRARDALIECGFTELSGYTDETMERLIKDGIGDSKYADCYFDFSRSETL